MSLKVNPIQVVSYNPDWPKQFLKEAALIQPLLGNKCIALHHIGSTSVPGLCAKEQIDILCIVDSLTSSLVLQNIGYVFKGEYNIPLRYFFSKESPSKVNLHVVESDHGFIELNLCFRDYLRAHNEARLAYAALKEQLIQDPKSHQKVRDKFSGYNLGKDRFIKAILNKAGFNGITFNYCMHDREWEEYHRIREEQHFKPIKIAYHRQHLSTHAEKNYHFVLYKGIEIVCVAEVEFLNDEPAVWRALATNEPYKGQGYETHMIKQLDKWLN
jgi:GrpB-like predicted nucleotidyltransferase (UPF0157 family)